MFFPLRIWESFFDISNYLFFAFLKSMHKAYVIIHFVGTAKMNA